MLIRTEPTFPWLPPAVCGVGGFGSGDISGVATLTVEGHHVLVAVSDEGRVVAFVPMGPNAPLRPMGVDLGPEYSGLGHKEIDLEGVAVRDGVVYAVGSLSLKRKSPWPDQSRAEMLERLGRVRRASGSDRTHSDYVYRLKPRVEGGKLVVDVMGRIELRSRLLELSLLAPFVDVPSKENGVDCEGLAFDGECFWLALRGPVLRGHALLVRFSRKLQHPEPFPLDLEGYGIRALTNGVADVYGEGLFLISGPTLAHDGPFRLWRYRPEGEEKGELRRLGEIEIDIPGGKVEALFIWNGRIRILLEGPDGGAPHLVKCSPVVDGGD